jgi:hypothetical protein
MGAATPFRDFAAVLSRRVRVAVRMIADTIVGN